MEVKMGIYSNLKEAYSKTGRIALLTVITAALPYVCDNGGCVYSPHKAEAREINRVVNQTESKGLDAVIEKDITWQAK
jgi:hypothetical protein